MLTHHRPTLPAALWSRARVIRFRQQSVLAVLALALSLLGGGVVAQAHAAEPTPTAAPPVAPQPTTGPGTATSAAGATLSGVVLTGGADTTYHFEYGTTTRYGLVTPAITLPAAPSPAPAVATIGGLTAATTYHYRLVAMNAAGVAIGADGVVTTPAKPHKPAVAARRPLASGATHATIVGRVNPYGQPTSYVFEWGTSSKVYGQVTPAGVVGIGPTQTVTAVLTGLLPNTRYVYRVVATNASGTVRSSPRSVTTGRGLEGVSLTAARRTLSWEGVTVVSGLVRGSAPGGTKVHLMRQDHPFTKPFYEVGTQKASAAGSYAFSISRIWDATKLKVVADSATARSLQSRTITLKTRLLARLTQSSKRSTSVRLRGVVYPANEDTRIKLERRTLTRRWLVVSRRSLRLKEGSRRGTFSLRVKRSRSRTLRYRMVVTPNDDGAHVTTTARSVYVARRR